MPPVHDWFAIGGSLVGGGAVGALITAVAKSVGGRQQPVGVRTQVFPLFHDRLGGSALTARIVVTSGDETFQYSNLFVCHLLIVNRGNRDILSFPFGVTLEAADAAIYAEVETPDRHHELQMPEHVLPTTPTSAVDFIAEPFNRGDTYTIKLYVTIGDQAALPGDVKLSSPRPVRFVTVPTWGETIARIASSVELVKVGPLAVSWRE